MEAIKKQIIDMYEQAQVNKSYVINFLKDFMKVMKTKPDDVEEFFKDFDEEEKEEEMRYEREHPEDLEGIEKMKERKIKVCEGELIDKSYVINVFRDAAKEKSAKEKEERALEFARYLYNTCS